MKRKLLLIGAGGHCKVVLDTLGLLEGVEVAGVIDVGEKVGSSVLGAEVIGVDTDLPRLYDLGIRQAFVSLGSVGDPSLRVKIYETARRLGFEFPNIISPLSRVSPHARLGEGNYIGTGSVVNAGVCIGNNCIVNTGAIVEHDCVIGDFVHISPGAVLSGGVSVGDFSHIGAGSVVIQQLKIGAQTIVGAGSVVTRSIRHGVAAWGNPCRERKPNA